nr:hypothetical protein [Candidatus Sigynarchaeota archaeon]
MAMRSTTFNRERLRQENLAWRRAMVQDRRRYKYFKRFAKPLLDD